MKRFKNVILWGLMLGAVLVGCRPDQVGPTGGQKDGGNSIEGAAAEQHPILDTICKLNDTIFFRDTTGNWFVNKCGWDTAQVLDPFPSPCDGPQEKWGYYVMYNGYRYLPTDTTDFLDVDFTLPYGWFCDLNSWLFSTAGSILIDPNTGLPQAGTDWSHVVYNPMRQQWKVRLPVASLPVPCFDVSAKMRMAPVDVNGDPLRRFFTTVWAVNTNWNNPNSENQSNNEYVVRYCPLGCLAAPPACSTIVDNQCAIVYTGLTCSNTLNSKVLTANATGLVNPVYNWSNGSSSASITVSPIVNTNYTVTVTEGTCVKRITTYNIKVTNVACSVPDLRADFCPSSLDIRPGQSFNIRNYVRMKNNVAVNWNEVMFTYAQVGANLPTVPSNWNLAAFNAGTTVTVGAADAATGTGNVGRGEYRIYVYRVGQTTFDDFMTIRVHPSRTSNVSSAACAGGACGYIPGVRICNVPPGQPQNATSICVPYSGLAPYNIAGLCGSTGGATSNYLGICGQNLCN
jgi:hypothetical protein